jgi:nucleotide-binding universal stress UspA family protein
MYADRMPGTIVVGVDGSEPSHEALRWAVAEARLREAKVVAVHVWTFVPPTPIGEPGMIAIPAGDYTGQLEAERSAAEAELEAALAEALATDEPIEIERKLVEGDAPGQLVAEAEGADLLVVGSRGRSGIASVLLGSVSRHVVSHAPCPVVVVKSG